MARPHFLMRAYELELDAQARTIPHELATYTQRQYNQSGSPNPSTDNPHGLTLDHRLAEAVANEVSSAAAVNIPANGITLQRKED